MLLTGYQPKYYLKKFKQFDKNLEPIISKIAKGRVIIKFNKFILVKKSL